MGVLVVFQGKGEDMSEKTVTTPIRISDHLTEQFQWTNKKHLADKIVKTKNKKISLDKQIAFVNSQIDYFGVGYESSHLKAILKSLRSLKNEEAASAEDTYELQEAIYGYGGQG